MSAAGAAEFRFLNFGIKEILVASRIQKSKFGRYQNLELGIEDILVASRFQNCKFGRCRGRIKNFGGGHFQLAPRPNISFRKENFERRAFPAGASAKNKNAKYKNMVVYIHIYTYIYI